VGQGPLATDVAAAERAKEIVAWTADLLVRRNLKAGRKRPARLVGRRLDPLAALPNARTRRLRVVAVTYQPEAAGDPL
jgi:hypothetical protein